MRIRVPLSESVAASSPLPGARQVIDIPEDAFGASTARALGSFGRSLGHLADLLPDILARRRKEMATEDDLARAQEKATAVRSGWDKMLGDYFASQGRDAVDGYEPFLKQFGALGHEARDSLATPRQKNLFDGEVGDLAGRLQDDVARHYSDQRRTWLDQVSVDRLQRSIDDARVLARDPQTVADLFANGIGEIDRMARRNRWNPEQTNSFVQGYLDQAHPAVIGKFLESGSIDGARSYLDANREILSPTVRADVEGRIGEADRALQAKTAASAFLSRGLDRNAALAETDGIGDDALRERTRGEVTVAYDRAEGEKRARESADRDAAWHFIENGGSPLDLAPDLRGRLDAETRTSLDDWTRARLATRRVKTVEGTWQRLKSMDPLDLAQEDLRRWRGSLSEADYADLSDLQRAAQGTTPEDRAAVLRAQALTNALTQSDVGTEARRPVEIALALRQQATGRGIDIAAIDDEVARVAAAQATRSTMDGHAPARPFGSLPSQRPEPRQKAIPGTQMEDLAPPAGAIDDHPTSPLDFHYRHALHHLESPGKDYTAGEGTKTGPLGRYQFTRAGLKAVGLTDDKGNFTGKYGIRSRTDFTRSPKAQEEALADLTKIQLNELQTNGTRIKVGTEIQGKYGPITVTETGLAAAAHRQGPFAVEQYFADRENYQQAGTDEDFFSWVGKQAQPEKRFNSPAVDAAIETRLRLFSGIRLFSDQPPRDTTTR